jgi:hypothetical protein
MEEEFSIYERFILAMNIKSTLQVKSTQPSITAEKARFETEFSRYLATEMK